MTVPIALALLGACAGDPAPQRADTAAGVAYPGRCVLLDIEQRDGEGDSVREAIQLVARYRFDQSGAGRFGLAFEVSRDRVDDLRAHLQQHAAVLCGPEPGGDSSQPAQLALPPFEGQPGRYVAAPASGDVAPPASGD